MVPQPIARSLVLLATVGLGGCSQGATLAEPQIVDVEWIVAEVDGVTVQADSTRGPLTLLLTEGDHRASGHAGCNEFGGTWRRSGDSLSFGPLATTRMYCEGRMELEARYGQALGSVTRVRVMGGALELLAGDQVVVRGRRGT